MCMNLCTYVSNVHTSVSMYSCMHLSLSIYTENLKIINNLTHEWVEAYENAKKKIEQLR